MDSTNDLARRIVARWDRSRPFPGLVLRAGEQTAGRGRRGRSWSSPPGRGLYLSVVRALPREGVVALPLLVGAAVCDVLTERFGLEAGLEWPNDVVVAGRKIAGVLVEVVGAGGSSPIGILGVGLNVSHRASDLPRRDATSIEIETGRTVATSELAVAVVAAVDGELREGARPGYAVARFGELTVHRPGDQLACREGDHEVRGLFDGLDPSGALRLRVGDEVRIVHGGELGHDGEDVPC
ncbi:MAG: biotin--[acetyl-CoA-carboxylase] ligase [Thermoanaerobaculia bacterium]